MDLPVLVIVICVTMQTTCALSKELVTPILVSPVKLSPCNSTKTQTCDKNARDSQTYRDLCELRCGTKEKIICMDHPDLGMIHFCFQKEQCPAGYLRMLIVNVQNKMVTASLELCPKGHFKPPTDCYEQCRLCITISPVPEDIVVFFEGDSFSPAKVYCNYKQGFFNQDNVTAINMTYYYNGFCENVKNLGKYPCISDQYLLPNGSCVDPCPTGYYRYDADLRFLCKPLPVKSELFTEQIPKASGNSDSDRGPRSDDNNTVYIILLSVFSFACVLVTLLILVTFLKSKGYLTWLPWFTCGSTTTVVNNYVAGDYIEINKSNGVRVNSTSSSNKTIDNDSVGSDFSDHSDTDVLTFQENINDSISGLKQVVCEKDKGSVDQTKRKLL